MDINLEEINLRKEELERAKSLLKQHFIGIDIIIDNLMDYIQVWYLMPDILNRPIIVNLWGMTGVGKTDLIRKLVKALNFQDRFLEVELSNVDGTRWISSVTETLERNELNDERPKIILFDEIQRFNTLDHEGKPMDTTKFTDFWELLSDGKLSKKEKSDLDQYLYNYSYAQKQKQKRRDRGEEVEDQSDDTINWWEAQQLKKALSLDRDISDLTELTQKDIYELVRSEKKKKRIYEPVDHSKTLIIISGNLDEAFEMARQTSESDIDADIFYAYTQKVTLVDIKNALSRKFRPEQVARFGNIHLIYTSLRKTDFEELIRRELSRVINATQEKFGITISINKSVNDLIYRNGVFPVQGVRPVFSSVNDILETNLSKLLFEALIKNETNLQIDYSDEKNMIVAQIGGHQSLIPYIGRIDKIRESNVEDNVASISVHESGHAIAYMVLFGLAPLQLKSKVASSYAGGFTFPHQIYETRETIINKIKIYLAGGLAEEIVFGKQRASIGRSNDREMATILAIDFIRKFGFDDEFQAVYALEFAYNMNKFETDSDIEKMIARLVAETTELLIKHKSFLLGLANILNKKGSLESKEIAQVAHQFGVEAAIKEEGFLKIEAYKSLIQ